MFEECLSKNDIIFCNKPTTLLGKHLGYNDTAVGLAQYGPHWSNIRRVLTQNFFATNRLNAYYTVRQDEKARLVKNLFLDSDSNYKDIEIRTRLTELTFNSVMRMATGKRIFGVDVDDAEEGKKFMEIISDNFEMSKVNQANDFFKVLRWIDFQGFEKKLIALHKKNDVFMQSLVDQIKNRRKETGVKEQSSRTLIDEMLTLQESDPEYYTDDNIKANVGSVISAGTDTSAATIEWAMALLLNHPEVLEKAKAEVDNNIGHDNLVDESDVSKLPYIQCIVNETLRLFPIGPIIPPHMSSEDCVVGGFDIPRGTMLLANAWALQRDPNVWDDPTSFRPERFEGGHTEGYKFVPFAVGRRQCPGVGMANRVVSMSLAVLIQCFEWTRVNEKLVDLSEADHGVTIPMKYPLQAMYKPREEMINVLSKL